MANRTSVPLTPKQAAARLSIPVADLPREGAWTRLQVRDLRTQPPYWLTRARRDYADRQDEKATQQRLARQREPAAVPWHDCFCCKTEFGFTIDSGGLCEACDAGDCPECGNDDDQDACRGRRHG